MGAWGLGCVSGESRGGESWNCVSLSRRFMEIVSEIRLYF